MKYLVIALNPFKENICSEEVIKRLASKHESKFKHILRNDGGNIYYTTKPENSDLTLFNYTDCSWVITPLELDKFVDSIMKAVIADNKRYYAMNSSDNPEHPIYPGSSIAKKFKAGFIPPSPEYNRAAGTHDSGIRLNKIDYSLVSHGVVVLEFSTMYDRFNESLKKDGPINLIGITVIKSDSRYDKRDYQTLVRSNIQVLHDYFVDSYDIDCVNIITDGTKVLVKPKCTQPARILNELCIELSGDKDEYTQHLTTKPGHITVQLLNIAVNEMLFNLLVESEEERKGLLDLIKYEVHRNFDNEDIVVKDNIEIKAFLNIIEEEPKLWS